MKLTVMYVALHVILNQIYLQFKTVTVCLTFQNSKFLNFKTKYLTGSIV